MSTIKVDAASPWVSKLLFLVAIAFVPAVLEEVFFREAIISYAKPHGKVFAVLLSGGLFALAHANLSQGLFAFVIGLLWGAIYLQTGDIRLTIFLHLMNNGISAILMILPGSQAVVLAGGVIVVGVLGLCELVKLISKAENRERLRHLCQLPLDKTKFQERFRYLFSDYFFVLMLVLMVVLGTLNESILRSL